MTALAAVPFQYILAITSYDLADTLFAVTSKTAYTFGAAILTNVLSQPELLVPHQLLFKSIVPLSGVVDL